MQAPMGSPSFSYLW
ncbi:hypothetical protein LINGRAPRIM_LOCUS1661 [Linum grandiflorum]